MSDDKRCNFVIVDGHQQEWPCIYTAVTNGLCADHGGARDAIRLNHIGAVDCGDVGKTTFKLSELFSTADLADGEDHEMELSVELVTENTNGALAARVKLQRAKKRRPGEETNMNDIYRTGAAIAQGFAADLAETMSKKSRDDFKRAFFETLWAYAHGSDQANRDWLMRAMALVSDCTDRGMSLEKTRERLQEAAKTAGRA